LAPSLNAAVWGAQRAPNALQRACAAVGLDASGATLVHSGANAVWHVRDFAVRVTPARTASAQRLATVFADLRARDDGVCLLPVLTPEPVETVDGTVTFWPWVDSTHRASWAEVGSMLRQFHAVRRQGPLPLPAWNPIDRLTGRIEAYAGWPGAREDLAELLRDLAKQAARQLASVCYELSWGPVHGHPTPNNTLVTADGPRFIDFDQMVTGPREWDLALAVLNRRQYGASLGDYLDFAEAYGVEVRDWPGCDALVRARQLSYVAFVAALATTDLRMVAELDAQVTALRAAWVAG
jgi:aminoglycoside phosphotransferase (APT) family kinase protein